MTDWDLTTRDAARARRNRQYHQVCPITYGAHRGPTNEALDRTKANGSANRPRHCGCQACLYGFTHIGQVVELAPSTLTLTLPGDVQPARTDLMDMFDSLDARWSTE